MLFIYLLATEPPAHVIYSVCRLQIFPTADDINVLIRIAVALSNGSGGPRAVANFDRTRYFSNNQP